MSISVKEKGKSMNAAHIFVVETLEALEDLSDDRRPSCDVFGLGIGA